MAAQAWRAISEHEVGKMQSNKAEEAQSCGRQSKNPEEIGVQGVTKLHSQVWVTYPILLM